MESIGDVCQVSSKKIVSPYTDIELDDSSTGSLASHLTSLYLMGSFLIEHMEVRHSFLFYGLLVSLYCLVLRGQTKLRSFAQGAITFSKSTCLYWKQ